MPSPSPRLLVGLGNPGSDYAHTRHNVGFWFVDGLAQKLKTSFAMQGRFFGETARMGDLWLLKPATFMNRSGQSVLALAHFYKILPNEIIVVHDDLDLEAGTIRLKEGGGNGGHNGLKDIASALSTPLFWRLRFGIGHPGDRAEVINYVLKPPRKEEQAEIDEALMRTLQVSDALLSGDFAALQRSLHPKKT